MSRSPFQLCIHYIMLKMLTQQSGIASNEVTDHEPEQNRRRRTREREKMICRRNNTGERGDWVSFRDLWTCPINIQKLQKLSPVAKKGLGYNTPKMSSNGPLFAHL